jgi:hypothetical protein
MKKKLLVAILIAMFLLAFAMPVLADGDDYDTNPGRQRATEVGAQCGSGAGSGAFGYFGKEYNMGINSDPNDPGANGYQTGLNNSAVCGNRP